MLFFWMALWLFGGWLIVSEVFKIPRSQRALTGLALGWCLQVWFSNALAQFLPVGSAFWLAAFLTLMMGLALAMPSRPGRWDWRSWWVPGQWLAFLLLGWVFFGVERGLNLFDDAQNLPTLSLIAAGDIPPHFPYDPALRYGYHYFLILWAAQFMRLVHLFPWTALDLARAISLSLVVVLMYLWVWRMTRSRLAAGLGAAFFAFASGTRWLLLILPPAWVEAISRSITLIGSAAQTAPTLSLALISGWRIEGPGPLPFPFAYLSGLNGALVMSHGGIGGSQTLILLLFLLLYRRAFDWRQWSILTMLFAAWALTTEYLILLFPLNLALALLLFLTLRRTRKVPASFWPWVWMVLAAAPLIALQGGVLTELARGIWERLWLPSAMRTSFHTFNFSFTLPSVVSGHLGFLSLLQPAQLLAFLLEMGPILLAFPLVVIWGMKMIRNGRWWEAALVAGLLSGVIPFFVKYSGTAGPSANARLMAGWTIPLSLYAFPLTWNWARRRAESIRLGVSLLGMMAVLGGVVLFGIELIAAQKPRLPEYLQELDVRVARQYWDRLPKHAVIFDPIPPRAPTLFARPTNAYVDWRPKPEWGEWAANPDPYRLRAAGFDYLYFDKPYWESLTPPQQAAFQQACVRLVEEWNGYRSETDFRKDFRRLLDIRECK
ncbi:MAG: hypothetical protein J7555_04460 [Chloroflexi bacterium]|nr:hypothetical protein [Chloroflexota bacterium]